MRKIKIKRRVVVPAIGKASISVFGWVIILTSVGIALLTFVEVLLRYVFMHPLLGVEEIAGLLVIWLWFSSMVYTTYHGFHIRSSFPIRKRLYHDIFGIVNPSFCLIITLVFCYFSYQYGHWTYVKHLVSPNLGFPLIYGVVGVFIGLAVMTGYFIRDIVGNAQAFHNKGKRSSP